MVKKTFLYGVILAFVVAGCLSAQQGDSLWPEIKPFQTGYLKVSKIHKIYYQLGGNKEGKPVMFLHGGPGGGCSVNDFRFFNPEKFLVVLHDQRGSGLSKPYGELRENTTWDLVADIEKLRKHLKLKKVLLFGGSWGSTLALAYAEKYPQNVSGMVLRGIFTSTKEEIDHYYYGGTAKFFPEAYDKLLTYIKDPEKGNYPAQMLEFLKGPDTPKRVEYAKAWVKYEAKIALLYIPDMVIDGFLKNYNPHSLALLENYYTANRCFLEEGQLLKHAGKLKNMPVFIVNGRYDMICPPITAYKLHKKLPKSQLIIVEKAGHSTFEPGIRAALVKAMRNFE